ncbi:MAG: hypothetical protein RL220_633 [Bacteroidota bacterium]
MHSGERNQFSRPIVKIATVGIAVGVALMMVSFAVVRGFQAEIRNKVIGFGSHFQVVAGLENSSRDSQEMRTDTAVYNELKRVEGVRHVQVYANKPGILETNEAIQGVVMKGVSSDFDWSFFQDKLKEGELLRTDSAGRFELIISGYMARKLKLKVGDKAGLYFINNEADARQRNFRITGIYETGLQDFDEQYVFLDIAHIQRLSGWGFQLQLFADTSCKSGTPTIEGTIYNDSGNIDWKWSVSDWKGRGPHPFKPLSDTSFFAIATDTDTKLSDTAWVHLKKVFEMGPCGQWSMEYKTSGGTDRYYVGGYEVLISDYHDLSAANDRIFRAIPFYLRSVDITSRSPEIFAWLDMLDINVVIIIVLMIIISVVNMTSALLILILERQNMIGVIKAMGATDKSVIGIFLIHAIVIIGRGVLWGNVVALALLLLQWKFGIIVLNPEEYYVDKVPVQFDTLFFAAVDLGTIVVCAFFLLLPSLLVTRITPIKAIRFN